MDKVQEILTKEELLNHEKHLDDYPDVIPTYKTLQRYIFNIRFLLSELDAVKRENESLRGFSKDDSHVMEILEQQLDAVKQENERLKKLIEQPELLEG